MWPSRSNLGLEVAMSVGCTVDAYIWSTIDLGVLYVGRWAKWTVTKGVPYGCIESLVTHLDLLCCVHV